MAMSGMDAPPVYYSDSFFPDQASEEGEDVSRSAAQRRFKEFIKTFMDQENCFCYRDQLKRHYTLGQYRLEVVMEDLSSFDPQLADKLTRQPSEYLPLVSAAACANPPLTAPFPLPSLKMQLVTQQTS